MLELKVEKPIRKYESVVILHPDCSEEEQKTFFRKSRDIIKSFRGDIHNIDTWGKRRLGNPIKKMKLGIYFHTMFEASGECVAELERTMRINDRVLRFTHTRLDDRLPISKHLEAYREVLASSRAREQEREAKIQARKSAHAAGGGFGGDRGDRGERPERGDRGPAAHSSQRKPVKG